jgi:FkbM family methyltransferase
MVNDSALKAASFLFKKAYFVYKPLYFRFKKIQDKAIITLCKKYIKPGSVIVDIGANIGFYSSIFSGLTGINGKVFSFEPDQNNFQKLRENISQLENCTLVNAAVAQTTGKLNFYISHRLNVDHRTVQPEKFHTKVEVQSVSLDDYLGVDAKVNFIKMDIQGAEMDALMGMKNILMNNDLILISELWPYSLKRAGYTVIDMIDFLNELNYTIKTINADGSLCDLDVSFIKNRTDEKFDMNILISKN